MRRAGKTTVLRHLLQDSTHGLRIGCVVNDVAAVNVDAKLVRGVRGGRGISTTTTTADLTDTVELANGCACEIGFLSCDSDSMLMPVASAMHVSISYSDFLAERDAQSTKICCELHCRCAHISTTL